MAEVEEIRVESFRDRLREDPTFREVEERLKKLIGASRCHKGKADQWAEREELCYRVVRRPKEEFEMWEKHGGYDPKKSSWGRYVCTKNRYLAHAMKEGRWAPPWLSEESNVVIETGHRHLKCAKYSEAAVGKVPTNFKDLAEVIQGKEALCTLTKGTLACLDLKLETKERLRGMVGPLMKCHALDFLALPNMRLWKECFGLEDQFWDALSEEEYCSLELEEKEE